MPIFIIGYETLETVLVGTYTFNDVDYDIYLTQTKQLQSRHYGRCTICSAEVFSMICHFLCQINIFAWKNSLTVLIPFREAYCFYSALHFDLEYTLLP